MIEQIEVKVNVEWKGHKAEHLPKQLQYITVAKFNSNWTNETWSIVLNFKTPPIEQGNPSEGYARFLMPDAPKENLYLGAEFELYEGETLTARVTVT